MTVTGKIVWTKNQIITTDGFLSKELTWNGRDDFGDKLGKGVYVYKLTVKSNVSNKKTEKFEKTCNTLMYYICLINRSLVMKNIIPILALLFCLNIITTRQDN
jgi:hypothetical protein